VAFVDKADDLAAWQQEMVAGFVARGIELSPYSQPQAWRPHITLGYIEPDYAGALGIDFETPVEIRTRASTLACF
jgi:hypothetical protein